MKIDAIRGGFHEAIALDVNGYLSEGSGENLFLVRDGELYTTPLASSILGGVTRASVLRMAEDSGLKVHEQFLPRELLYVADEVFFTGTAAEITPIRSVDKVIVGTGEPGPITKKLQSLFFGVVKDANDPHGWLKFVYND
jgi:branched-chain amino acid aminotransferase